MGRKRKIPIADEKENAVATNRQRGGGVGAAIASNTMMLQSSMYTIISKVQINETTHKKYIKELKQLYAKMDHEAFMFSLMKMIKAGMVADEGNEHADTLLIFCSKFVSSFDGEDTHPVLIDICKWLLTTISRNPHLRFRICQFVNMILKALGQEAALDDAICDRIMEYMLHRLHDTSPNVRVQAILAMQRLQVPDNPDDPVLRAYQYHLCSDPSSRVRQAVITCMGRNYHTIPYILERLWDIDEKVRRHTYLHMSSYPVRSYKVAQRLTLLQQGLNDRCDGVRKVVVTIMLQQWIESYQKDLIALISALKLDSTESEIDRFRKVAKQTLKEIFKRQNKEDLLACIPLEEDDELHHCVPYEKLTMEIALYWQCLTEFLQAEMAEEFDFVVPELSIFCRYVEKFCHQLKPDMDKFELMEFQYKLLSLMEILYTYDLGDEIGRGNLQKLLAYLLKTFRLDEKVVEVIVRCAENLITDENARIQLFVEIIQDICDLNSKPNDLLHDRTLIAELLASSSNADLNLKLSSLKVKILDLEEQEMNFVQRKDYMRAQQITEEKLATTEEYTNLLKPLLDKHPNAEMLKGPLQLRKTPKPENILKSLQIAFYMDVSPKVRSLNPSILKLYNDFICRHLASNQIAIRDWALKCGTACSMLYETLAKDVFEELYAQFFKNHNIRIWETSITCIFELLDKYGLDNFAKQEEQNKTKKSGRQLYNTLEFLDSEDDSNVLSAGQGVDVIYMMSHFLDTCDDTCIVSAIIIGFCRLILRGYIKSSDIIEKLLLRYFNPSTDPNINQILGVFLEKLIQRKKHGLLQPCLLPMVSTVLSAPYENPLHDIRPETITRFIIDSTRQESSSITGGNIHNKIAQTFLQEMLNNLTNKELCKILAKELTTLELNVIHNQQLKLEMKETADKLIQADLDSKAVKHIIDFKDLVDGNYNPTQKTVTNNSDGEEDSNDETENEAAKDDDDAATATTARSKTPVSEMAEEASQLLPPPNSSESSQPSQPSQPPQPSEQPSPLDTTTNEIDPTPEITEDISAAIEVMPATVTQPTDVPVAASTTSEDSSIITKDISPSARVPTTYGRENRVGHRYLRKSLNSTRGQSDTEAGDGPQRSPKIRIEARIDSDKKTEPPPREEQRQVRNTRARRNLRYGLRHNEAEQAGTMTDSADNDDDVPINRRQNRERGINLPTITVTAAEVEVNISPNEISSLRRSAPSSPTKRRMKDTTTNKEQTNDEEPAETTKVSKRNEQESDPTKDQPTEQLKEQQKGKLNEQPTEQLKEQQKGKQNEQPKDQPQITTRGRDVQQAKVTPANKISMRSSARKAAKAFNADELNSSDVIPPSPPTVMSPRTIVRRQRRAGGGDISVANLTESQGRATRSQSAQSATNKDSDSSSDSEAEKEITKPSTPARTTLKRALKSTPNPTGKQAVETKTASPQSQSPDQKRMRSDESPSNRQQAPPITQATATGTSGTPNSSEKRKRGRPRIRESPSNRQQAPPITQATATGTIGTPNSSEKRKRGRPRIRALEPTASENQNNETPGRYAESNSNELNVSKVAAHVSFSEQIALPSRSLSAIQATESHTRTHSATHAPLTTRTSSTTRALSLTRTQSATRAASPTRTRSSTRASLTRTRSSLRTSFSSSTRVSLSTRRRPVRRTASPTRSRSRRREASSTPAPAPSATRTSSMTRIAAPIRTRSATRTPSVTRAASTLPAETVPRTRSAMRANAVDDTEQSTLSVNDSPTKTTERESNTAAERRTRSTTRTPVHLASVADSNIVTHETLGKSKEAHAIVSNAPSQPADGMMTHRRLSASGAATDVVDPNDANANTNAESEDNNDSKLLNVTIRRRDKSVTIAETTSTEVSNPKKPSLRSRPSKIPVRASSSNLALAMKPRHVALRVSSSLSLEPKTIGSNSSSGSGSSSAEETMKTLGGAMLRRRALTTKMTRINLTQRSKGNPVPMEVARPTRAHTSVNKLATGMNLRAVKKR